MKFKSDKTYTLAEIERLAGQKSTYNEHHNLYGVVDVAGDFAQYDFSGKPDCLTLVQYQGETVDD